jgi:iron complex outermembrane recepter protein
MFQGLVRSYFVVVLVALSLDSARAAQQALQIDLPAGSLQQALDGLANLTHLQILYDPDLLRGKVAKGVHGKLTPAKALAQLLGPTDIGFEFTADDAVALRFRPRGAVAPPLGAEFSGQVRTVTISADRNQRLAAADSAVNISSVKIDEPSLVVPVSSASLSYQLLRDQQVVRLEDVVEFVSGTENVPDGQSASGFGIRGFPSYQYYLDGVRVSPDQHHDGFRDFADIERIDVLKGPASLLYGRTEPGGLINLVPKRPLAQGFVALEQQFGSYDHKRTQLDTTGPLDDDSLLYRFNAAWEDSGSFRESPHNRRVFLAPVVTWNVDAQTALTGYLEYLNSHDYGDSGLPIIGNRLPNAPISRSFDAGGEIHTTDLRVGVEASHRFDNELTLSAHLDARWLHAPQSPQIALAADGLVPVQCQVSSCPVDRSLIAIPKSSGHTYFVSIDAFRDFSFWHTRHSVLADVEFFQSSAASEWSLASDFDLTTDLYQPREVGSTAALLANPDQIVNHTAGERWESAYLQDQVQIGERLYLLLGARYDGALASNDQSNWTPAVGWTSLGYHSSHFTALKQREGIVWRIEPWLSVYGKYAENFGATAGLYQGVGADGITALSLPEQSAQEWEAGLKLGLDDARVEATLAFFSLTKTNIASALLEPALNPTGFQFLTGTARNQGVELDFHGELLPGLTVLAS